MLKIWLILCRFLQGHLPFITSVTSCKRACDQSVTDGLVRAPWTGMGPCSKPLSLLKAQSRQRAGVPSSFMPIHHCVLVFNPASCPFSSVHIATTLLQSRAGSFSHSTRSATSKSQSCGETEGKGTWVHTRSEISFMQKKLPFFARQDCTPTTIGLPPLTPVILSKEQIALPFAK